MTAAPATTPSKKSFRARLLLFLAVVGPGFITANVDNDAGGIWTYSVAGAQFGYSLLWTMIPTTIALVVVQEMASRMGAVTGKGLSDLIREEFGFRITFFLMLALVVTNFGNIMAESVLRNLERIGSRDPAARHALAKDGYVLVTVHRPENTDHPERLARNTRINRESIKPYAGRVRRVKDGELMPGISAVKWSR